jgi:hypothetical protein
MQVIRHQYECMQLVKPSIATIQELTNHKLRWADLPKQLTPLPGVRRYEVNPGLMNAMCDSTHALSLQGLKPVLLRFVMSRLKARPTNTSELNVAQLPFLRLLQHVRLHRVESVGRVRESFRGKMLFKLSQKNIAPNFRRKLDRHAALVVRRGGRRCAKLAAA